MEYIQTKTSLRVYVICIALLMAGCGESPTPKEEKLYIPTYSELANMPIKCSEAKTKLPYLREVQAFKNFDSDPEKLNAEDEAYNSVLKMAIWMHISMCHIS